MAHTNPAKNEPLPPLAIAAGAIGFVLSAALIGFIGWEAVTRPGDQPPALVIEAGEVHRAGDGYVVEFTVRNSSPQTAAAVVVEARLEQPGTEPVTGQSTLDFVAGRSSAEGGVFLPADPRQGSLSLRALGYSEP